MILYLFRHGIAIDRSDPSCPPDPERYLTDRGVARTQAAADGIAALGIKPGAMISSPLVRARQTAEIAMERIGFRGALEVDRSLIWDRPPEGIAGRLEGREDESVMLVGHAPHLDELAAYLVGAGREVTSMKKASLIELRCYSLNRGGGYILGYYPPRVLRQLGGVV